MGDEPRMLPKHAPSIPAPSSEEREGPPTPVPRRKNSPLPPKTKSGEHEAVVAFRKKLDSIDETTMPLLEQLNKDLNKIIESETDIEPPPSTVPERSPEGDDK